MNEDYLGTTWITKICMDKSPSHYTSLVLSNIFSFCILSLYPPSPSLCCPAKLHSNVDHGGLVCQIRVVTIKEIFFCTSSLAIFLPWRKALKLYCAICALCLAHIDYRSPPPQMIQVTQQKVKSDLFGSLFPITRTC